MLFREEPITGGLGQRFHGKLMRSIVVFWKPVQHGLVELEAERKTEPLFFILPLVFYVLDHFAIFVEMNEIEHTEDGADKVPELLNEIHFWVPRILFMKTTLATFNYQGVLWNGMEGFR